VKALVHVAQSRSHVSISCAEDALPVWVITDGCNLGILGIISQETDWKTAKVATFYSAKLNSAQRNYPVHEIEMLVGVETMLRHKDVLLGVHFKWLTNHKGLIYLLNQKNLSGRQAQLLEK
jgi:RNase H-like domain found in reverse transcriptase